VPIISPQNCIPVEPLLKTSERPETTRRTNARLINNQ